MVHDNYRYVPEIDDTLIGEKLRKGETISFSPEEMPSEIVLLLGGSSASRGIGPVRLRILNVSDWPVSHSGQLVYSDQATKSNYNNNIYTIDPTCRFLVVSGDPDLEQNRGIKGIRPDEPVVIGRESECERFPELNNASVSRHHLKIMCDKDGRLTIVDTSTNGTMVEYYRQPSSQWDDLQNFGEQGAAVDPERWRHELIFARPTSRGRDRFGNDLDKRLQVTDESRKDAALAYQLSDREVKAIVEKYATPERWRTDDVHKLIRENNELRVELGECILQKLESSSIALPDRVWRNGQKRINYTGYDYPDVSSHEAVALIALSMLDGTFKRTLYDPVEIDERTGTVSRGQHRWTAANILGIDNIYLAEVAGIKRN